MRNNCIVYRFAGLTRFRKIPKCPRLPIAIKQCHYIIISPQKLIDKIRIGKFVRSLSFRTKITDFLAGIHIEHIKQIILIGWLPTH